MKHLYGLVLASLALVIAGVVMAQTSPQDPFEVVQTIGKIRPRGIQYDANYDRFIWVDERGQLILADAQTFEPQHILYRTGFYNAYTFSNDGRWLALAIDTRIEVWDTEAGTLSASLEPDGALRVEGPLTFSDDGLLLSFNTQVRAPRELRRSENDTVNLPWIWDVGFTRRERRSTLPQRVEALPFFDFRNGFIFGPNGTLIIGLPQRIMVQKVDGIISTIGEIPSSRFEQDPITVWRSLRDESLYVAPNNADNLVQIDTPTGAITDLQLRRRLGAGSFNHYASLARSNLTRIIGGSTTREENSLLRLFLGENYTANYSYHPLTVTLIDILEPMTPTAGSRGALLYVHDETAGYGEMVFVQPESITALEVHPNGNKLLVQRGTQKLEVYDIETGILEQTILPAPTSTSGTVMRYTLDGSAILNDFQRFDAATGAILHEDLTFNSGFEQVYFTPNSENLVTVNGSTWWAWNIASGDLIRREQFPLYGSLLRINDDASRYMTSVQRDGRQGIEIVEVGKGTVRSVFFEELQDRSILEIIPSPNWEHYLVVYSANEFGPYHPDGNVIAVYSLDYGKQWLVAGDDLPFPGMRQYGWLDNTTVYVYGERGGSQPTRIYDVNYDTSGLPACLVETFPNTYGQWLDAWERFSVTRRGDALNRLALRLCESLPGTEEDVNNILFPSPTPTRAPVTATPSTIIGVPLCLTNYFPNEAREYAEDWRRITEGLSDVEIEEMEILLCESLTGSGGIGTEIETFFNDVEVMTLDVVSGQRAYGGYIPTQPQPSIDMQPVLDEFRRAYGYVPSEPQLSPDQNLLVAKTQNGHLIIYRLNKAYSSMVADAQATAEGQQPDEVKRIGLQPTATVGFDVAGTPRPTLTPTVTPTSPPPPLEEYPLSRRGETEEVCPAQETLYTLDSPPEDFAANGTMIVQANTLAGYENLPLLLNLETGDLTYDETVPNCNNIYCNISFDGNWFLTITDTVQISHPDGSNPQVLYTPEQSNYWPEQFTWKDLHTLEYSFNQYIPERSMSQYTFIQHIDPTSDSTPEPFRPENTRVEINELPTEIVTYQPGLDAHYAVVRTSFNTGRERGFKLYIYDTDTDEAFYFARMAESPVQIPEFYWHPLGHSLYYHYPGDPSDAWYIFDTTTQQHYLLGVFPGGEWSRDGRYRVSSYGFSSDEINESLKTGEPIPKIQVWDSETGLIRRYCLPQTEYESYSGVYLWSPDNRYIALRQILPADYSYESPPTRTLLLDTQTGSVTQISTAVTHFVAWMEPSDANETGGTR